MLYYALIYPQFTYGIDVWGKSSKKNGKNTEKNVVRCVGKAHYLKHILPRFQKLHILKFQDVFKLQTLKQMHLYFHNMIP